MKRKTTTQPDHTAAILRAVQKCGLATRHHFLTAIKRAGGLTDEQAASEFERMRKAGFILRAGFSIGSDVEFYEADKNISAELLRK